jgi:DUF4097 and DUF4098 domain-containing protein YvlB
MKIKLPKYSLIGTTLLWLTVSLSTTGVAAEQLPLAARYHAASQSQDDGHFSRTIKVGKGASLDLSNVSGDVTVRGGPGDEIEIEAEKTGHGDPSRVKIEVSQTGDRVRVETKYSKGGHDHVSVEFDVTVPWETEVEAKSVSGTVQVEGVRGELQAESVSGEVIVRGAQNLLVAQSVSGSVEVESAAALADAEISSVSGDVQVRGLKAPEVEVSSVSGDITLTDTICERVSMESVSGGLRYSGPLAPSGRYEFQTHSGDVRISISNDVGFELEAETFSGDISSDFPLTVRGKRGRRELSGVYGDGSAVIEAGTFSGSVEIARQ